MSLTFTDIFCGAGGSSLGLTAAGLRLVLAANHWATAIATHAANFTDAEHLCADVNNYDMRRLPTTDILWASPICTEASPTGKKTRRRARQAAGQGDLLQEYGHVARAGTERTRATFHDVIRATEVHRYKAVLVENVPEVAEEWELFFWWVDGMTRLGYRVQYVSVSSVHIGNPGNPWAPQWRDRLYLVFTRTGIPLPDVDPRPLAWCPHCDADVPAVQWWKKPGPRIGRYRRQYAYRCPNTSCRHALVEPYVRPAASIIDWTNLGDQIGDRPKPLAANTIGRIEAGLAMFTDPMVVRACGSDPTGSGYVRAWPAVAAPLGTRLTTGSDGICTPLLMVPAGGTWAETPMSALDEPMRTRTANPKGFEALVTPTAFLTVLRNHGTGDPVDRPTPTVTAGGNHLYLTTPPPAAAGAFYVKNHGGYADPRYMVNRPGSRSGRSPPATRTPWWCRTTAPAKRNQRRHRWTRSPPTTGSPSSPAPRSTSPTAGTGWSNRGKASARNASPTPTPSPATRANKPCRPATPSPRTSHNGSPGRSPPPSTNVRTPRSDSSGTAGAKRRTQRRLNPAETRAHPPLPSSERGWPARPA